VLAPYLCPARVATIGIGTTVYPDGRKVKIGDQNISDKTADDYLAYDLTRRYVPAVDGAVTAKDFNDNRRSACYSLAYNIGTAGFRRSTVCWHLNRGNHAAAAKAFVMWRMGGGRVLAGLERRRRAEAALYLKPVDAKHESFRIPAADVPRTPWTVQRSIWQTIGDWFR